MKGNVGTADRAARLVLAALGWWLAASVSYATAGGGIVLVVAGILVVTAAAGYCPLYSVLSVSTRGGWHRTAHA